MWKIMYTREMGSGKWSIEFIPLNFQDFDRDTENDVINKVAALIWYGFLYGRLGKENEFGEVRDPKVIWEEPVDLSVTEPPKPANQRAQPSRYHISPANVGADFLLPVKMVKYHYPLFC